MKIAIDAKSFYSGPVSTRIILQNLVPELVRRHPNIDWIIFLDKKHQSLDFPCKEKNVHLEYIWAGINQLSNLFVLPRHLKKQHPDLVLYQMFPSFTTSSPAIAMVYDVIFREFPFFFTWKERLYFFPIAFLTRRAKRVITLSEHAAEALVKYNYVANRSLVDVARLGVSPEFKPADKHDPEFLASVKKRLQLPDRFLLFVGRLNVRKNLGNLLKAFALIKDKDISLVVVGDADGKFPDLEKIMTATGIRDRIILAGSVNDKDLQAVFALSTIFCFPSFAEGFGLPPLEAMASGVPVIVSNNTSLPEVCGDAAVYTDPHQPSSIADAIDNLLSNSTLYEKKKAAGIIQASQFTWEKTAIAVMKSISKALPQSSIEV